MRDNTKIINPATAALAITVGSIAGQVQTTITQQNEQIKTPIAQENQPSPFTRSGPGLNNMVKPELVEYGGNQILSESYNVISQDNAGKLLLLNNKITNILKFDYGTSYSTPKVAHLAGKIANKFPNKSSNFIKNLLLAGADYSTLPNNFFYTTKQNFKTDHIYVNGYGLSTFEKATQSFDNRVILFDENRIGLNQIKVYSLIIPDIFFSESGKKKIIVTLTFNPETRSTRGDSYLGNRMEFHLFHTITPQSLIDNYGNVSSDTETPENIKRYEISLFPGSNIRKAGCNQKAWKEYLREPRNTPSSTISLVLLNFNKWISDLTYMQDYCVSVTFEHESEIDLYNTIRTNIITRVRV